MMMMMRKRMLGIVPVSVSMVALFKSKSGQSAKARSKDGLQTTTCIEVQLSRRSQFETMASGCEIWSVSDQKICKVYETNKFCRDLCTTFTSGSTSTKAGPIG